MVLYELILVIFKNGFVYDHFKIVCRDFQTYHQGSGMFSDVSEYEHMGWMTTVMTQLFSHPEMLPVLVPCALFFMTQAAWNMYTTVCLCLSFSHTTFCNVSFLRPTQHMFESS